jgi:hypothetical protein
MHRLSARVTCPSDGNFCCCDHAQLELERNTDVIITTTETFCTTLNPRSKAPAYFEGLSLSNILLLGADSQRSPQRAHRGKSTACLTA